MKQREKRGEHSALINVTRPQQTRSQGTGPSSATDPTDLRIQGRSRCSCQSSPAKRLAPLYPRRLQGSDSWDSQNALSLIGRQPSGWRGPISQGPIITTKTLRKRRTIQSPNAGASNVGIEACYQSCQLTFELQKRLLALAYIRASCPATTT